MSAKCLKAFKVKNRHYWWLVEAHREGGKPLQKKLKYWGVNKPGEEYRQLIMPLDDNKSLDDLSLVWRAGTGVWCWQRRGDFKYWYRRRQENWFWKSLFHHALSLVEAGVKDIWITRASTRSESINNVREKNAVDLIPFLVMQRISGKLN